jgi:hypothetical protein
MYQSQAPQTALQILHGPDYSYPHIQSICECQESQLLFHSPRPESGFSIGLTSRSPAFQLLRLTNHQTTTVLRGASHHLTIFISLVDEDLHTLQLQ